MKVKINTKQVTKKIEEAFKNLIKRNDMYVDIANFAVKRIQDKSRLQKRMETDGDDSLPTPNLSESYKQVRRGKSYWRTINGSKVKFDGVEPRLSEVDPEFFFPAVNKSQLTFTGQLLRSLKAKILRSGDSKGSVELGFTGTRKGGQTNVSVYKYLLDLNKNYEVLALSKKAIDLIRNKVLTRLRQELIKKRLK